VQYRLRAESLAKPLDDLDQRCRLFNNLPIDPTHEEWLRQRAWIRHYSRHDTDRGNTLSDIEVEALLAGEGAAGISQKEAREIIGTREALSLADRLAAEQVVPDESVVREIHKRVLWNQSPILTPGNTARARTAWSMRRGIPSSVRRHRAMYPNSCAASGPGWARHRASTLRPLSLRLPISSLLPSTHSTTGTAGRLERFLADPGARRLCLNGLVSLDAQLDLDRPAYFAAIREAIGQAYDPPYDATPFVAYFLGSIVKSADYVLARIRGLGQVMVGIRRAIVEKTLPPAMIDGLAYAWVNRHIRAGDYIRLTGRSAQTTTRELATAVRGGWLVPSGDKRGRYYVLGPRLLATPAQGEVN